MATASEVQAFLEQFRICVDFGASTERRWAVTDVRETMFCPMCEAQRLFRRETRREEYDVRGEKVALDVPRRVCHICGEAGVAESFGDPAAAVYAEYRRRHNLLTPQQVRAVREKYDLSQASFAALLGASPATLERYDGGSLQDKAYDHLLRACDNPEYMADLVRREGHHLSPRQRRDVEAALHRLRPAAGAARS